MCPHCNYRDAFGKIKISLYIAPIRFAAEQKPSWFSLLVFPAFGTLVPGEANR
jgi:hypothetical protein